MLDAHEESYPGTNINLEFVNILCNDKPIILGFRVVHRGNPKKDTSWRRETDPAILSMPKHCKIALLTNDTVMASFIGALSSGDAKALEEAESQVLLAAASRSSGLGTPLCESQLQESRFRQSKTMVEAGGVGVDPLDTNNKCKCIHCGLIGASWDTESGRSLCPRCHREAGEVAFSDDGHSRKKKKAKKSGPIKQYDTEHVYIFVQEVVKLFGEALEQNLCCPPETQPVLRYFWLKFIKKLTGSVMVLYRSTVPTEVDLYLPFNQQDVAIFSEIPVALSYVTCMYLGIPFTVKMFCRFANSGVLPQFTAFHIAKEKGINGEAWAIPEVVWRAMCPKYRLTGRRLRVVVSILIHHHALNLQSGGSNILLLLHSIVRRLHLPDIITYDAYNVAHLLGIKDYFLCEARLVACIVVAMKKNLDGWTLEPHSPLFDKSALIQWIDQWESQWWSIEFREDIKDKGTFREAEFTPPPKEEVRHQQPECLTISVLDSNNEVRCRKFHLAGYYHQSASKCITSVVGNSHQLMQEQRELEAQKAAHKNHQMDELAAMKATRAAELESIFSSKAKFKPAPPPTPASRPYFTYESMYYCSIEPQVSEFQWEEYVHAPFRDAIRIVSAVTNLKPRTICDAVIAVEQEMIKVFTPHLVSTAPKDARKSSLYSVSFDDCDGV
ncbi:hypothetical protein Pelo_4699 [Pelomyxa schiedti]|nr:hypothetical protein Pelo_4699 [Pelomyxa schiedti]